MQYRCSKHWMHTSQTLQYILQVHCNYVGVYVQCMVYCMCSRYCNYTVLTTVDLQCTRSWTPRYVQYICSVQQYTGSVGQLQCMVYCMCSRYCSYTVLNTVDPQCTLHCTTLYLYCISVWGITFGQNGNVLQMCQYLRWLFIVFFFLSFMFKSRHATASAVGPIVTKIGMMIPYYMGQKRSPPLFLN